MELKINFSDYLQRASDVTQSGASDRLPSMIKGTMRHGALWDVRSHEK